MSRNDYIKGYSQGYNNRPPPTTAWNAGRGATEYVDLSDGERKRFNARVVGYLAEVASLKKALHEVAPDHPLVNPLRTKNNPILKGIRNEAEQHYLRYETQLDDEEYEHLAASKGEGEGKWANASEPATPVQSHAEEGEPGVEGKPVKEKKGGFWGWFNNPTGVGA